MNKQLVITFVLLFSLAMVTGLVIVHNCADASADGGLPKTPQTLEVAPDRATAREESHQPGALPSAAQADPASEQVRDSFARGRVNQALLTLPLRFIANAGQTDPAVRFTVKGAGHTLFFTDDEVVFSASGGQRPEDEGRGMDSSMDLTQPPAQNSNLLSDTFQSWVPFLASWSRSEHPELVEGHSRRLLRWAQDASARLFEKVSSSENSKPETSTSSVVRLRFLGANPHPTIEGLAPMSGVANFFLGNDPAKWRVNVPTYGAVAYRNLYPGIDLVYRGTEGRLKSEFRLAPGADPAAIQMAYSGVEGAHLREDGTLVLQTPLGELIEEAPLMYQEVDGVRQEIPGGYVLLPGGRDDPAGRLYRVGFQVAAYDPTRPLVIDPELAYSTYLGGGSTDRGHRIAVDGSGNAYVAGPTLSIDFPIYRAIDTTLDGGDAFVTQIIGASGVFTYGYSTYLGGSSGDGGRGIAVDNDGNVYVTGSTESTDFPTHNAIDTTLGGSGDAFVTQIISAGGSYTLGYSTYLGGGSNDGGNDIAADGAGNVYVTGYTSSSDFPNTNEVQSTYGGAGDAFVTQIISTSGVYTYGYSTYLGGYGYAEGWAIAVDDAGNAYVTGETWSSDFPTTTNAIQPSRGGGSFDAFVTQIISANGFYTYGYSSYLGGTGLERGRGIAVDGAGNAYMTGQTQSSDFPTISAIQSDHGGGGEDAFVTKIISATGFYTYGYSTYLGGDGLDIGNDIAVDGAGNAYVTGPTYSSDFPTRNAIQPDQGGADGFVTQIISVSGFYTLSYSTYLGGGSDDGGYGIAVDGAGNVYVTGFTYSSDFPTRNAIQTDYGGGTVDAFVAKITVGLALNKAVTPNIVAPGQMVTYTLIYTNNGVGVASGVLITDVVPITLTNVSFTSSGAQITPTGSVSYTWQVAPLAPGAGGVITITGIVSPSVSGGFTLTNRAIITSTDVSYVDTYLDNNTSVVHSTVALPIYLPLIMRAYP